MCCVISVYKLEIPQLNELQLLQQLSKYDNVKEVEYIQGSSSNLITSASFWGHSLVRYALCNCFSLKKSESLFVKNEFGKPFLRDYPEIQFNLSHSGKHIVCAVCVGGAVGIDVETIKPYHSRIPKRFFSDDENIYIQKCQNEEIPRAFFELWTMKESYIKMLGKGLFIPLRSFSIFQLIETGEARFRQVFSNDRAVSFMCYKGNYSIIHHTVKIDELIRWWIGEKNN